MVNNDYGSFCCRRLCYEFSFVAENRLCKTSVDGRFGFQMAEHDILRGDRNRKSKEPKGDSHLIFSGKPGEAKFNTGMDTNRPKGLVCVLSRTGECGSPAWSTLGGAIPTPLGPLQSSMAWPPLVTLPLASFNPHDLQPGAKVTLLKCTFA